MVDNLHHAESHGYCQAQAMYFAELTPVFRVFRVFRCGTSGPRFGIGQTLGTTKAMWRLRIIPIARGQRLWFVL